MTSPVKQEIDSKYPPLAILGLLSNNYELPALLKECLNRIDKNKAELRVSFLSSIDGTLVTKCYGWLPNSIINPELLTILRKTELASMPDGFLRGLAKILGAPLAPAYAPLEFFTSFFQALGESEKGVFILGGIENDTKNAAIKLHDKFNKLRLVGIATPPVFIQGENLIYASERDNILVDQINSSNADVLFVNLGSSKQWIWLERVRHLLTVPFVLTIDQSLYEIWDEQVSSKENSSQGKKGLEVIKPSPIQPSWSTKSLKYLKLVSMALPLAYYQNLNRCIYKLLYSRKDTNRDFNSQLFISSDRTMVIIALPTRLDITNLGLLKQKLEEAASHDVLVFDFKNVRHIQPEGFYLLIKTWQQRKTQNKEVYGFSPSSDMEWLMKLNHSWDVFKNTFYDSVEKFISRLTVEGSTAFYDAFIQDDKLVTISLLGSLDNNVDYANYLKKIVPIIGQKDCCIDFSYCTYIDNTGFIFLINLRKHLDSLQHNLILGSVNNRMKKQFRTSRLDKSFTFKE
ncbi:MAG TPA: WecB/TagA/CpsF family glycosyltransferase [Parachlamydiaceae bacterium]|nr:WecB/TagA/CpsF family glycosyltransferase [Parachlamydiaceae bacterium]